MGQIRRGVTQDLLPTVRDSLGFTQLAVAFQPIVDVKNGRLFACEALVRPTGENIKGPIELFAEAIKRECVGELGRIIRQLAIDACPHWPLFLNIHPLELDEGWLTRPDDPVYQHDNLVFIEITESVPMSRESYTFGTLRELRAKGVSLVVDDLGAGYSNLKYIADLEPKLVKLDRALVCEITESDRVFRLIRSITALCADLGALVVAEGIEREEELKLVREAGVQYGQGYLIARPSFTAPHPVDGRVFALPGVVKA
jgi:EAL domain-containing protein (putative c-di-GMP-specific phosphodiesterase class I)